MVPISKNEVIDRLKKSSNGYEIHQLSECGEFSSYFIDGWTGDFRFEYLSEDDAQPSVEYISETLGDDAMALFLTLNKTEYCKVFSEWLWNRLGLKDDDQCDVVIFGFEQKEEELMNALRVALSEYKDEKDEDNRFTIVSELLDDINADAYGSDNIEAFNDVIDSFDSILSGNSDEDKELDNLAEDFRFWCW